MAIPSYDLARLVGDLRSVAAGMTHPGAIVERVRPLARQLAPSGAWIEQRHDIVRKVR